uniref:PspA/IM30 family protein n=1 Tax=Odontella aurita TaxID=265563 RepID=A0A7S4MNL8_9STRA|mmetsp:Transcript_26661/g.78767  ORF Transcript_26661/g.78767 Transcript_26661/m.78767 type:complete len:300 (+) Transcript_26661:150-1049(+)|eukprot:CAMPEP_0113551578 /NCGR_PEP_ID=MMETSP0015_2-20120614/14600_1 /TAXON_ID=2838 /ORGANISM="Odontella" /LENGTH=299 /DNA_ID=CAMNT_0000452481 /DNA_START=121 /DNA_END=1020 /DNA_ORIENTATION=+ /assembly_acc=CAM_ASM_000160
MKLQFSVAAVALALVSTDAFSTAPSFASRTARPHQDAVASKTALSMNMFDRFARVAKGSINDVLKKVEDPEKIMTQAIEDMQSDLVKIRQSYAEITATQRRLLKQKEQADALAEDWYARAQLALQKGNEGLAREALERRQQNVDTASDVQNQIDAQGSSIDQLYEGMQTLEAKILESKSKKEQMVARARTAQSTQKVNDMLSGVTGSTSMDAFQRMEEKVEALEAAAEVSAEMGAASGNMLPGSSIEKEFRMLEAGSAVDDELKKMKGLLGGSTGSESGKSSSGPVDDEFEKLKKDAGL